MSFLCLGNPSKLAVEVTWLLYFLVWSTVVTIVMVGGFASTWGDVRLMLLGVGLALGALVFPMAIQRVTLATIIPQWLGIRWTAAEASYAQRNFLSDLWTSWLGVTTLSLGLNYGMTWFFFDVLHMRFGFKVSWEIDRNPIFLYFMTVAYFSTYSVVGAMLYRRAVEDVVVVVVPTSTPVDRNSKEPRITAQYNTRRRRWHDPRAIAMRTFAAVLLAFLETLLMANPLIADVFCYDDLFLVLTFGSACYAVAFVFSMWCWTSSVPECPRPSTTAESVLGRTGIVALYRGPWHAIWSNALASVLTCVVLRCVREYVAPHVTVVVPNSPAFGGCLLREH